MEAEEGRKVRIKKRETLASVSTLTFVCVGIKRTQGNDGMGMVAKSPEH